MNRVRSTAQPSSCLAVRCRAIIKTYGKGEASVSALRGIDLDVHCGELLVLAGPSGCGKTTLVSIIGALLEPDRGTCEVLGLDLARTRPKERASFRSRSLGFVFQADGSKNGIFAKRERSSDVSRRVLGPVLQ
jgi:putative ABC transport system ATP-binding protein